MVLPLGWLALRLVPLPPALFAQPANEIEFFDRNGEPLRAVHAEDTPFLLPVPYGEIPEPLVQATLAAEDRRFWSHPGADWRGTLRAAWQLLRYRRVVSGGSTVTQQLIKIAQPRPRTFRAKLLEAAQALRLEQVWDKQHILAEYLSRVDYGNWNRGCAAAAGFYFAKSLRDLSIAECAFLAALPQAPSRLNPHAHLARAIKRQRWVLGQMREQGWLSNDGFQRALAEPIRLAPPARIFEAPHFIDLILARNLAAATTQPQSAVPARLRAAPKVVRTTLDLPLNRWVESLLRQNLDRLQAHHVSNGAVVVLDNQTGNVLALVGSENYFSPAAGQVNGAWMPRSAGSTFKPFTYLLALERGATPATVVADVPTEFPTATGVFVPMNYNRHCFGPMRYRLALANSLNIPAVRVLASVGGPEPLQQLLQESGLTTLNRTSSAYGLGLTIGNAEARLLELANAYACLARLGEYKPYRLLIDSIAAPVRRIADSGSAYLIADILSDNDARTLAFGPESPLRFEFPVACKTGTSSDFRDNWAFGYTPEFTAGVWVGNFDGTPMDHVSGVTGAAPMLHGLFEHLHRRFGTSWYKAPTNIVDCLVHPVTGKRLDTALEARIQSVRVASGSPQRFSFYLDPVMEKFLSSSLPPLETLADYELPGMVPTAAAGSSDPGNGEHQRPIPVAIAPVRLTSEYRDWLAGGDNWLSERAVPTTSSNELRITFPLAGTVIYLDADLPSSGGQLPLRSVGPPSRHWESPSLKIISPQANPSALLTPGRHDLLVRDDRTGASASTWITVLAR